MMDDSIEARWKSLAQSAQLHKEISRRNKIAAIVADTCREPLETAPEGSSVPAQLVTEMLNGILAALAGRTDWESLKVINPDTTPLACARVQVLLDGEN